MVLTLEPGLGLGDFRNLIKSVVSFNEPSVPAKCISDCWKSTRSSRNFIKHLILDFSCLEIFGLLKIYPFLLRGFAVPVKKLLVVDSNWRLSNETVSFFWVEKSNLKFGLYINEFILSL